jgi:hypothetical protein
VSDFELSIPPLLVFHFVFNVELLRPYFPPPLKNLDIVKHLAAKKPNIDCIEYNTIDYIMDRKRHGTLQENIQLYQVIKTWQFLNEHMGQFLHEHKWLTNSQIQH